VLGEVRDAERTDHFLVRTRLPVHLRLRIPDALTLQALQERREVLSDALHARGGMQLRHPATDDSFYDPSLPVIDELSELNRLLVRGGGYLDGPC